MALTLALPMSAQYSHALSQADSVRTKSACHDVFAVQRLNFRTNGSVDKKSANPIMRALFFYNSGLRYQKPNGHFSALWKSREFKASLAAWGETWTMEPPLEKKWNLIDRYLQTRLAQYRDSNFLTPLANKVLLDRLEHFGLETAGRSDAFAILREKSQANVRDLLSSPELAGDAPPIPPEARKVVEELELF